MAEFKKQPLQQKKQPVTIVASKQATPTIVTKKQPVGSLLFSKDNYTWMMIGGAVVLLGMLLMTGGKSANPNVFDYNVVYSFTRITLAPFLIILGLMIEIYAIFKKPKTNSNV